MPAALADTTKHSEMRGRDGQMPSRYHRQDTGEQVLACYQDEPKSVTLMVAAPFLPKWSSQLAIAAMDEDEYPVRRVLLESSFNFFVRWTCCPCSLRAVQAPTATAARVRWSTVLKHSQVTG